MSQLEDAIREMQRIAAGKTRQEALHSEPIRKSLCDDLFTLAANTLVLGPSNDAEACILGEVHDLLKRLTEEMGYSSIGAFLTGLRERAR